VTGFWPRTLALVFSLLLIALMLWGTLGRPYALSFLVLSLLAHVLLYVHYLVQLEYWLEDPEKRPAPDGMGIWGDIYSRLNRMVRKQVHDRESHKAALNDMEQATSALPEGVVILDATDHIEWCNPLAEQHLGIDNELDSGQQITYLARQPEFVAYLARREYERPLILRGTRQDSLIVLSIKLIDYGENKRLLISRDITQFERIEAMRRDFVANVSHELRTPLTVVNGFVETMVDMPDRNDEMAYRALKLMGEQTSRMNSLVDDLLTLSTLESELTVLDEEKVSVVQLMQQLLQEGKSLSNNRHELHAEIDSTSGLLGNSRELHSAFGNLVSNAIRYTPEGGKIVLRWREEQGLPVFSVQDSGIGISQQHLPRLTERFYRVDRSRSRETGGTGLGLAIVKHVANRHQAQLDISSEEGQGSTFSMTFPEKRKVVSTGENQ